MTTKVLIDDKASVSKRYLRQLTEYGYLESHGGNRNRTYQLRTTISE